ncbi:hypothetical protein PMKS-000880 [Pichia membranifaciens]|uniref:Uncharacterized protein n=1 Tax=Pichia membranifaciens TaxID=4926 RepID=A0A1Q2YDE7_9ASCO|nr:hypothetical protein PMKS-000880 [Pichia membranifaciens]
MSTKISERLEADPARSDHSTKPADDIFIANTEHNFTTNPGSQVSYAENTTEHEYVNTDDCVIMDIAANGSEKNNNNNNNNNNMYYVNPNFAPNRKADNEFGEKDQVFDGNSSIDRMKDDSSSMQQSWLPSILRGESWPEQNSNYISDVVNGIADADLNENNEDLPNPLLTVRETVLRKNDSNAKELADWRKYKEDNFFKMINNNKLKDLPSTQSTIPNTFANKFNKIHGITNEDLSTPDSPLKLFDVRQNTYTKFMMHNMLNQLSPKKSEKELQNDTKIPKVIKQSEELYNKILTGSSSSGSLLNKAQGKITDTATDDPKREQDNHKLSNGNDFGVENPNNNVDVTSDAEEFSSFPSTTRKFVHDGEQLFENIRDGLQQHRIPLTDTAAPYSQSDYTSADDNEDGDEAGDNSESAADGKTTYDDNDDDDDDKSSKSVLNQNSPYNIPGEHHELLSQTESFNAEFNIRPPQLRSQFRAVEEKDAAYDFNGNDNAAKNKPKGLNFIPADEYKNKVYDKKLKKYVLKNEYDTNSSYTDDIEIQDGILDNISISDPDRTSNSILRNANYAKKINQEVTFESADISNSSSNATIDAETSLNESFAVSDGLLVEAISQSYPAEDWNFVKEIDLSEFELKQLYHLDKMTPNIWYLNASHNQINQNFGIPKEIQVLNLAYNNFNSMSAKFDMFQHLQVLDLSQNELTDLRCLKELKSLTSLNLSNNKIESIEFLENFRMLHYLNLSHNEIAGALNFRNYTLWVLEDLIMDDNEITELINLSELPQLVNLSANNNNIVRIFYSETEEEEEYVETPHFNLRRISLNNNSLYEDVDLSEFPETKEIQLDRCFAEKIRHISLYTEKISARYISEEKNIEGLLRFSLKSNNLKSLYLTGGILPRALPTFKDKFSSINILDISAMNLETLPKKFGEFFPLLIDLNLNFNRLRTLNGLEKLRHLKQLKLLGNEIENIENITDYTSRVRMTLRLLDVRVNPLTTKFYPFIFYGEDDDSEQGGSGASRDNDDHDFTSFRLHEREDIEAFSIEYSRLYEEPGMLKWAKKNRKHQRKLSREVREERNGYLVAMLVWFEHVKYLDGDVINEYDKRAYVSEFA